MNAEEALKLCRMAKALFPHTPMDEYTPDAWALAFKEDRYVDAEEALAQLVREVTFIDVAAIVGRIKRIRRDRILAFGTPPEPPGDLDPDNTLAYRRWARETARQIADGESPPQAPAVASRRPLALEAPTGECVCPASWISSGGGCLCDPAGNSLKDSGA